ncbi:MAG: ABC transporter permease [Victivallales bacterium]|nr:ABC transporter permease [Victivallales bacterium]
MLTFILRRLAYSLLIVVGVMVITFLLFRVAAGDPSAALLGKNPTPDMVESLRQELGTDKPLFWGHWRRTEAFTAVSFRSNHLLPGVELPPAAVIRDGAAILEPGMAIRFHRNFSLHGPAERARVCWQGELVTPAGRQRAETPRTLDLPLSPGTDELELGAGAGCRLFSVMFFKAQKSPWDSQFFDAMGELVCFQRRPPYVSFFNFGRTLSTREPVIQVIRRGVGPSLLLMLPIFFGELLLGIVLALLATAFKGTWIDKTLVLLSVIGMSVSYLVFIIFGQWYLGYYYNFFPVWGWGGWRHLALPIIIGIVSGLGGGVRFYRTVFVNELNREYLRTARAKGCGSLRIYGRHLLRNAAIPIITRAGAILPFLFTGSLLLETFFGIPGLGYAGINALNNSDLQMIKALVIISALLFVSVNLLADITYAWVDPRIRLK